MAYPLTSFKSLQIPPPSLTMLGERYNTHPRGLQNPHPVVFFSRSLTTAWWPSIQKDEWVDTDMSRYTGIIVQSPSRVQPLETPWTEVHQASLALTIFWSLPKFMSVIDDAIQPSHPLVALFFFPSMRDFSNESSVHIRWPKYWILSFIISPSNEYSGLISLKIGLISLLSKWLSGVFSSTTVQRHQFFGAPPSSWPSSHNCTWPLGRPLPWLYGPLSAEKCLWFLKHCLGLS